MFLAIWGTRKTCRQRDLESLIVVPNHAFKVVCPVHLFIRLMLDFLKGSWARHMGCQPIQFIFLNREFC